MIHELLSQDEAEAILLPHLEPLRDIVVSGWDDWHKSVKASPLLATVRDASRAGIVYDKITERAEAYFDSLDIPTNKKRQFLEVVLADGQLVLRFKKFRSRALGTSGIPTQQRRELMYQQVVLDGMAVTYAVVGYLPDELGVGLDVVAVACSYGNRRVWHIDLAEDQAAPAVPVREALFERPTVRSTRPAAEEGLVEGQ